MKSFNQIHEAPLRDAGPFHQRMAYYYAEHEGQARYCFIKKVIDRCLAVCGLIAVSPLLLAIALLIKLEDRRGAVLFKQVRIGKHGKPFQMYKFRSMVCNAESMLEQLRHQNEVSGAMFKIRNDPRMTRVGKWLRKTSMDELPQLFNVIKGEMSLVGPRPPLPDEVEQYSAYHRQRLQVIPGCTGLWQISGRNSLGFEEMVELDMKYIRDRNVRLDLFILLKTCRVLFGSKNAF